MKKLFAIIGLISLASVPNLARAEIGFSIFISNAPPAPRVIYRHEPRFVLVPEEQVYYVDDDYCDYDVFRYGSYFYLYDEGYWYRANSYRGPFVAIRIDYIPRQIFSVSSHGYRWRQTPRWDSGSYTRYRDNHDGVRNTRTRYSDRSWDRNRTSDRRWDGNRTGDRNWDRNRQGDRDGSRRIVQAPSRDNDRDWRDGRDSRDRQDENQSRGQGKGKGKGKGNGKGNGNGNGHGRGHGGD